MEGTGENQRKNRCEEKWMTGKERREWEKQIREHNKKRVGEKRREVRGE